MAHKKVISSSPGSIMLSGEHAVLYNKHALCTSISKRIITTLEMRSDKKITIYSTLGSLQFEIGENKTDPQFSFVLETIKRYEEKLSTGFDLIIESELPSTYGLGTSSAVTTSLVAALEAVIGNALCLETVFQKSVDIIRFVQKRGSGADVAASVYGKTVLYKMDQVLGSITTPYTLSVVYSGSKMKTPEVIEHVNKKKSRHEALYDSFFSAIDSVTLSLYEALEYGDYKKAGELLSMHQGLHHSLGVSNKTLSDIVFALENEPGIYGAKISGSGLGDSCIGLGTVSKTFCYPLLDITPSNKGVIVE